MKNKQTLIAGGVLVILALLYYLTQTGSIDTRKINTDMYQLDADAITSVTVLMPADSLTFYQEQGRWMLLDYPVDTTKMSTFLTLMSDLKVDRLITRKPAKAKQYELDEQGTRLAFIHAVGDTLGQLILGKRGANYQETFVRAPDQTEIYAVRANLGRYRQMKPANFWDKTITDLSVDDINDVVFSGELNYQLHRDGPVWNYNDEPVDLDKVTGMLRSLEHLRATGFAESITSDNQLYQSIHIKLDSGDDLQLSFYLKDAKATTLLTQASGHNKVFEYSKSGLNRFKRELKDLQADPIPTDSSK